MFRTGLQGAAALPWKLSYKHWRRHLAKPKTECNFSVLFKSWRHCYSPRGCILKFPILVRVRQSQRSTRKSEWSKNFSNYFLPRLFNTVSCFEPAGSKTSPSWKYPMLRMDTWALFLIQQKVMDAVKNGANQMTRIANEFLPIHNWYKWKISFLSICIKILSRRLTINLLFSFIYLVETRPKLM